MHKQIRKNYTINMAKLSQQLKQTTPARVTRTQRQLAEKKRQQQIAQDQKQFDELKTRAEQVQQEKLSNLQSIEQYQEVYNEIDPELRQFFISPSELSSAKSERIAQSKTKLLSEIERIEGLKKQQDIRYQQSLAEIPLLDPRERGDFKRDIKNEHRIATASIDAELGGLREGLSQLNTGQEISVGEIKSFAKVKAGESADVERNIISRSRTPKQSIKTRTIDANYLVGKMSGLTSEGLRIVRNATGGESEVEIFSVKGGEKIQVVREKDTGKIYYTDLEGKKKGERIEAQGLSDKEIRNLSLDALKKRQEEREPFVDVESVESILQDYKWYHKFAIISKKVFSNNS